MGKENSYDRTQVCAYYVRDNGNCTFMLSEVNKEREQPDLLSITETENRGIRYVCTARLNNMGSLSLEAIESQKNCTSYQARGHVGHVSGIRVRMRF